MSGKKWLKIWISIVSIILLSVGIFNFLIDPFLQYRMPTMYNVYYDNGRGRYLNPGLAKMYEYDSVVIGSSMTQNFLISDLKKIIKNPIKLCIGAGTSHEISKTLEVVFRQKPIDSILLGLDLYALRGDKLRLAYGHSLPDYLYDSNIINDYKYIISRDTFKESIKSLLRKYIKKNDDLWFKYENMYQWQHLHEDKFGRDKILASWWRDSKNDFHEKFKIDDWSKELLIESFEYNILKHVKKNPNTKFIIFYPPYSILAYTYWKNKGILHNILEVKEEIFTLLNKYPNVELYDFQNNFKLTTNLDLYKDYTHYHQKVNTYIVDSIFNKNYLVTHRNYKTDLEYFRNYINNFKDY